MDHSMAPIFWMGDRDGAADDPLGYGVVVGAQLGAAAAANSLRSDGIARLVCLLPHETITYNHHQHHHHHGRRLSQY